MRDELSSLGHKEITLTEGSGGVFDIFINVFDLVVDYNIYDFHVGSYRIKFRNIPKDILLSCSISLDRNDIDIYSWYSKCYSSYYQR